MAEVLGEYSGGRVARIKEGVTEACDVAQAIDWDRTTRARVGHVLAFTIAGTTVSADLSVENPLMTQTEQYVKVVGAIEKVAWGGGRRDPVEIDFWVSAGSWQKIAQVEHTEDEGSEDDEAYEECSLSFVVYDYDPLAKKWYKSFHTNDASVKGLFRFDGRDIVIDREPHETIRAPLLYHVRLCAKPKPPQQDLMVGLAADATQAKAWGDSAIVASLAAAKREKERVSRRVEEKRREEEEKRRRDEARTDAKRQEEEAKKKAEEAQEAERKRLAELEEREAKMAAESARLAAEAAELEKKAREAEASAGAEEAARLAAESAVVAERRQAHEEARIAEEFEERERKLSEKYEKLVRAAEEAVAKADDARRKLYEQTEFKALAGEVGMADELARLKKRGVKGEAADLERRIAESQAARTRARLDDAKASDQSRLALDEKRAFIAKERADEMETLRSDKTARLRAFLTARDAAQELRRRLEAKVEEERERREELRRQAEERRLLAERARVEALAARGGTESRAATFDAIAKSERAGVAAERAERMAREARATIDRQAKRIEALERELGEAQEVARGLSRAARRNEFRQDMALALKLTIDGQTTEVPGGAVSMFRLEMETWGYRGEVEFAVSLESEEDELLDSFSGTRIAEIELSVQSKFQPESEPPDPLVVKGIVIERRIVEDSYDALSQEKVLRRRYRMTFGDPAWVLWKQHFPCELFNEKKLQDVIDAHKGSKITITGEWPGHWDLVKKFIFLGLGDERNRASFYDFLLWYIDRHCGVLVYDAATNAYAVLAAKPDPGEASKLDADDVERVEVRFPEVPRYSAAVLNAYSEASTKKSEIAFDDAVSPVRRDFLTRTEITTAFDDRGKLETFRLVPRKPEPRIIFARFPTITFAPGTVVDFSADSWSADLFTKSGTFRVRSFRVAARATTRGEAVAERLGFGEFALEVEAALEDTADTVPHLPPFVAPRWPVLVEGKIVSEQGEETDETWQFYTDSDTSIDQYKVKVPLFEDKTVLVDFNANTLPGHFFFPAFKNARVLLALEYDRAWIKRFLDWRPGARLPADTQGNHLLLGKNDKSQTSINHVYEDEKPVLNVKRLSEKDVQTIVLKEGTLTIEVKEESE